MKNKILQLVFITREKWLAIFVSFFRNARFGEMIGEEKQRKPTQSIVHQNNSRVGTVDQQ